MKICAGVILFNPNIERLSINITELKKQVNQIIMFDNNSDNIIEVVEAFSDPQIVIVRSDKNIGIAAALNRVMEISHLNGFAWVLSMDQDAVVGPNLVDTYVNYINQEDIGIICPKIFKRGMDNFSTFKLEENFDQVSKCPTSGTLLRVECWQKIGGYNEWLFIDYVDYDLCIQSIIANYKVLRVNSVYIIQDLGDIQQIYSLKRLAEIFRSERLIKMSYVYNHSPLRNYYFVRNSIYYIRKYYYQISVSAEIKKVLKWELKKLMFEKRRFKQLKAIHEGFCEGLKKEIRGDRQ